MPPPPSGCEASHKIPARAKSSRRFATAEIPFELFGHPLDQEVAERDAAQALLTVGDGVEHCGIGAAGVEDARLRVEQRLNPRAHTAGERDLDEDQRFVDQAG